jgi:hypothetical protein
VASTRAFGARSAAVVTGRSALRLGAFAMLFTSQGFQSSTAHEYECRATGAWHHEVIRLAQTGSRPQRLPLGENVVGVAAAED